ncbi:hypothetical protein [Coxiella burnetii]|uniref:hypothetical protein n=1 Tax=Coxiella burnetii TaxID=777 RepID=UPI0002DAE53F|nr:hypothetical protein [Coxiella burnetii]
MRREKILEKRQLEQLERIFEKKEIVSTSEDFQNDYPRLLAQQLRDATSCEEVLIRIWNDRNTKVDVLS